MIEISQTLPTGAVFGQEVQLLDDALRLQKAAWFRARAQDITCQDDDNGQWVESWQSTSADPIARPTRPNDKNGRFDTSLPMPALQFRAQTHCGYSVRDIAPSAERFSLAVIYCSENRDARTLFSIAGPDHSNILFGNEADGQMRVQDRAGTVLIECDAPQTASRYGLLVVSYQPGKLRICINDLPTLETSGTAPGLNGNAELFIAGRSHRPGLAKTLGDAQITDLIFWPDRMILGPKGTPTDPSLILLRDFWRWNR